MADLSIETARDIVSTSIEHEIEKMFDFVAVRGSPKDLELAINDLAFTQLKISELSLVKFTLSEFKVEESQLLAYAALPTAPRMGHVFVSHLLKDKEFVEAMKVLLARELDDEWITSEEASQILGFSRTYTNALLASDDFEGSVNRTTGGHRRISKRAVVEWKQNHGGSSRRDAQRARAELRSELDPDSGPDLIHSSNEGAAPEVSSNGETKLQRDRQRVLANRVERS